MVGRCRMLWVLGLGEWMGADGCGCWVFRGLVGVDGDVVRVCRI